MLFFVELSILNFLQRLSREFDVPGNFDLAISKLSMTFLVSIGALEIFFSSLFKKDKSNGAL